MPLIVPVGGEVGVGSSSCAASLGIGEGVVRIFCDAGVRVRVGALPRGLLWAESGPPDGVCPAGVAVAVGRGEVVGFRLGT